MPRLSLYFWVALGIVLYICLRFFLRLHHEVWGFIDKSGAPVIPMKFRDVARDEWGGVT
jgi:hypothetical protein